MTTQSPIKEGELVVSSKILGHISEGLYRGPAGVLKELVANAYDANAGTVWISTGRPTFDVVSVQDDGDGMTLDKFQEVVSGGIGDSDKRSSNVQLINKREVIGRLGIGILGISQISHEFSIISHARASQTAFKAHITMKDFRKEVLDSAEHSRSEGEESEETKDARFQVGNYEAEPIPFDPKRAGLTLTATEPTEGFRHQLSEDEPDPLPGNFLNFTRWSGQRGNLDTGPWYNKMVWQLASLAPISYMSNCNVCDDRHQIMTTVAKNLKEFDFSVILDGIKLFKPVLLDGPAIEVQDVATLEEDGPFLFPLEFSRDVWGTTVKVRGYIYSSAGLALHPTDLRGILIRLKHVGIGEYDKSFLGYRFTEGPRFAWLTGELYVEEGLENALTIGRDGFDVGHPHYIALRTWLHNELQSRVFPTLHKGMAVRRVRKETEVGNTRQRRFLESISSLAGRPLRIERVRNPNGTAVHVDIELGVAVINDAAPWPRGKRQRELAQRLGIIFELVHSAELQDREVDEFINLTRKLLSQ